MVKLNPMHVSRAVFSSALAGAKKYFHSVLSNFIPLYRTHNLCGGPQIFGGLELISVKKRQIVSYFTVLGV